MEIKEKIINEYVIGGMSLRALEKKYGISCKYYAKQIANYIILITSNCEIEICANER